MRTTIYFIRHSEPFKVHRGIINANESILIENEKSPLSINGEKMSEKFAGYDEFTKIDKVISSNYVRAMSTAKYFAVHNDLKVDIDERFNERIHGVDNWKDLPDNFEKRQFMDEYYKIGNGESQKEVQERMIEALTYILNNFGGQRIVIVSHATAIAFLLKMFSEVSYDGDYSYNEQKYFDGCWNYLETFKLEFDENKKIINIENINYNKTIKE